MIVTGGQVLAVKALIVYAIGLDSLTARALYADLSGAAIQRRRPLRVNGPHARLGPRPDLILVDLTRADGKTELEAARKAWGEDVLIVGLGREAPFARVWRRPSVALMVEISPGFLRPFL